MNWFLIPLLKKKDDYQDIIEDLIVLIPEKEEEKEKEVKILKV